MSTWLKKMFGLGQAPITPNSSNDADPVIIPRKQHCISRNHISRNALKVLYRLNSAGHEAYLVGGGVRDLLLDLEPKDFDIATSAKPEQIRKLFRNCRLIGRRFLLAHVRFRHEIIEVATFRANPSEHNHNEGMILSDNVYGTLIEDAFRRDFTVNALYYNIADYSLVDHTGGLPDLHHKQLRLIGDPEQRYREDPVRILRAVRLAAKLDFDIEEQTRAPIKKLGYLLEQVPSSRLLQETQKLLLSGRALPTLAQLQAYNLLPHLFPSFHQLQDTQWETANTRFLEAVCENSDDRIAEGLPVLAAFLYAAFLWYPIYIHHQQLDENLTPYAALEQASSQVLDQQKQRMAIPKHTVSRMREIWQLQYHLERRNPRRVFRLINHPRFRAGFDFLKLRALADPELSELAEWWSVYYSGNQKLQRDMIKELRKQKR